LINGGKAPNSRRPSGVQEDQERISSLQKQHAELKQELDNLTGGGDSSVTKSINPAAEPTQPVELKPMTAAELANSQLNDLFDAYTDPPGEMDLNMFKMFCRQTYSITKKLFL
jgi:hypothetical protein